MESNNAEKNATLKKKHLKDALAKRMAWIKVQLPQLAYLVSNVVVYVDRHPMHNKQLSSCCSPLSCINTKV